MANFIGLVYATLKNEGIDTKEMDTDEAIKKYNELQEKTGGKPGEHEGTPAENRNLGLEKQSKEYSSGNKELDKKLNKIRNAKKENLIVVDENNNIVFEEGGDKLNTGFEDYDYKGKTTYHNHPDGKAYPYPSIQDFKTAENSGMSKMVIVSKGYTYEYEQDKDFKSISGTRPGLSKRYSALENSIDQEMFKMKEDMKNDYKNGKYASFDEYKNDVINKNIEYMNNKYQELAKNSGYKLNIYKH